MSRLGAARRRLLFFGFALVVGGLAFGLVLPRLASYEQVWEVVRSISVPWLACLAAATALNVLTFVPPWQVALDELGFVDGVRFTQASTAVTFVVPGGAPIGMGASYTMLRSWGFGPAQAGRAVAVTGIWNQLSTFLFPVLGVLAVAAEGEGGPAVELLALAGLGLFVASVAVVAFALRGGTAPRVFLVARAVASTLRRLRGGPAGAWTAADLEHFRAETVRLLRDRWPSLTLATLANQLTGFAMLDLALRAGGIGTDAVSVADSFTAWSVGRLVASLPLTPGGLGFVEVGLTGLLIGFGGPSARVVAAVLVYRILSIVPTVLLGLLAASTWKTREVPSPRPPRARGRGPARPPRPRRRHAPRSTRG